ncbi:MAG: NAD(P)/FAD-dependent oxidoreductase [Pseudomonadota bacterium]
MNVNGASITILGAGLTGSLLAVMLAKRGMRVLVIERQADPRVEDTYAGRSINLAMAARGLNGLRHAGLEDAVAELLYPMRGRLLHPLDGPTQFQPYGSRTHEINYSVSRAELNRVLLDAAEKAGAEIRFAQRCVQYDPEKQQLRLEDQRAAPVFAYTLEVPRIIAADGAGSPVRRALGRLPGFEFEERLLDHLYQEIAVPPASGEFAMRPDALHIWPRGGYMLIALPNPGGDFTGTLFMRKHAPVDEPSFDWWQDKKKAHRWFSETFPDVPPMVPDLPAQLANNPTGVMGTVRCNRWNLSDQVLLIGDAAHAIVPFHGQGMNAAFEDCVEFDKLLEDASDWRELFDRFSRLRVPNANAIATMALENYVEMRDTVRDPKFHLKKSLAFELERRLPECFIPRYSMVMFHESIPYAVALARGETQSDLLSQWTHDHESLDSIDIAKCVEAAQAALPRLELGSM